MQNHHNLVKEYMDSLSKQIGADNVRSLCGAEQKERAGDAPFLSVVMRTQGNRLPLLEEAMLCLLAQTNQDFEVLLMGHNLDAAPAVSVEQMLRRFPEEFQSRVRFLKVSGGTRTTPLNQGFAAARGKYIAIFDDDDLLFDHWVETFYQLYQEHNGKILHAYCVEQDWKMEVREGVGFPVANSGFSNTYCRDFNMLRQITGNACPVMTLAFPAHIFHQWGLRFDEKLTTTEDWDFLMRSAFISGVCDAPVVTGIYRHWQNINNSSFLHNREEWERNYERIQEKFAAYTVPIPLAELMKMSYAVPRNIDMQLYADCDASAGSGSTALEVRSDHAGSRRAIKTEELGKVRSLRLIPSVSACPSAVREIQWHITDVSGNTVPVSADYLRSNYVRCGKRYVFLSKDPRLVFRLQHDCVCNGIELQLLSETALSAGLLFRALIKHAFASLLRGSCRLLYRLKKRLLG